MTTATATTHLTVRELYDRESKRLNHKRDAAQLTAVVKLDELRTRLLQPQPRSGLFAGLLGRKSARIPQRGLYFWGGVGRGKTFLMDLFFHSLPFKNKQRSHFHRFMQSVHEQLKKHTDHADPLELIADRIAAKTRVLCFDELFVADIADAMLLGTLFTALFARGVTLVATSNIPPDQLYKDGLQRARFLPAIKQIKTHTDVLNIDSGTDYRLRLLERAMRWFDANAADTRTEFHRLFEASAGEPGEANASFILNHRKLTAERRANDVIWFTFKQICDGPRGQADYIELARCYHTVLLSDVPILDAQQDNQTRRFISLVDEFYDRGVKLIVAGYTELEKTYQGTSFKFEFERTRSRLIEMQAKEYLAREHKA
ncbi:MAG: cell division protein ZapE [Candidatus Obscuribacterales bacterium]|nr:cell division protein ZapE [Steroidobacteraceae bacterium]